MQFVESKHTPRNTLLRATLTGGPVSGGGVRKEYDDLVDTWAITPKLAVLLDGPTPTVMRERYLLGLTAVPFLVAAFMPGSPLPGDEVTRFQDPDIIESSALVVVDGMLVTTNDSGDTAGCSPSTRGPARPSASRSGPTTRWTWRRWRRRVAARCGWATSGQQSVARLGLGDPGRGWRASTPTPRRTSWSTRRAPATPSPCWPTRRPAGSTSSARESSAAPCTPPPSGCRADHANRLDEVGPDARRSPPTRRSSPTGGTSSCATTPRPRSTPGPTWSWSASSDCRTSSRGRDRRADDGTIYASSEGLGAPVLRISLPAAVRRAMAPPERDPQPDPQPDPHRQPDAATCDNRVGRLAGGAAGGAVGVGLGARRRARDRDRHRARPRPPPTVEVGAGRRYARSGT